MITTATIDQIASIINQLNDIDRKSIRAIRAADATYMAYWEGQAKTLRTQLAALLQAQSLPPSTPPIAVVTP